VCEGGEDRAHLGEAGTLILEHIQKWNRRINHCSFLCSQLRFKEAGGGSGRETILDLSYRAWLLSWLKYGL
jgi:hypothetical protein